MKPKIANLLKMAAKEARGLYPHEQGREDGDWLHKLLRAADLLEEEKQISSVRNSTASEYTTAQKPVNDKYGFSDVAQDE